MLLVCVNLIGAMCVVWCITAAVCSSWMGDLWYCQKWSVCDDPLLLVAWQCS